MRRANLGLGSVNPSLIVTQIAVNWLCRISARVNRRAL
jgi:hypothetical protein